MSIELFSRTVLLLLAGCICHAAEKIVISARSVHLRSGDTPEWEEFAARIPDGRRLDLTFVTRSNRTEATLFIQQDEVRQDWFVELNGRRMGKLFTMEARLVHTIAVAPGMLRDGTNKLSIIPPKENDDIFLHDIVLDSRPAFEAAAEATVEIGVVEEPQHRGVPCRITITDSNDALATLTGLNERGGDARTSSLEKIAVRPGVVYTGDGLARLGLPAGAYTVYASRGFEYGVATQHVRLAIGETKPMQLAIRREVQTPGLVSSDTHVHTFTYSRHGDATIEERMLTLAGEGIELPIATDHNLHIDYEDAARRMNVRHWFTPVVGSEVTTAAGHFNIFPVNTNAAIVDSKITEWSRLDVAMRSTPDVRVVVLNHPRNIHNAFQPFAGTNFNAVTGDNKRGSEFRFDAMEVLNSSAQQSDYLLVFHDWFALLNHGYRVTGVGSSDSHDVSRYIVGQGRTYIESPDDDLSRVKVGSACSNLMAGHAFVSMGLLVQMTVNDRFRSGDLATNLGAVVRVHVTVSAPSWIKANHVTLFANGTGIRSQDVSAQASVAGVKAEVEWTIPRPAHDVYLVALATGPGVDAPFWATPKPYQPSSPAWTNRVIGCTNPIWLDGDGDGRFTSARTYALRVVESTGGDSKALIARLGDFDEAVAVQAAALCAATGLKTVSPSLSNALRSAKPQVQRGFAAYAGTE